MSKHHRSRTSYHSYQSGPEGEAAQIPARKFPITYVFFIIGGLFVASVILTIVLLSGGSQEQVARKVPGGLKRSAPQTYTPPASSPSAVMTDAPSAATSTPSSSLAESPSFSLDSSPSAPDASAGGLNATAPSVSQTSAEAEQQRKEGLAEMEIRSKNFAEAERIYRELLPDSKHQPLTVFQIYACLVEQGKRDSAQTFLNGVSFNVPSPTPQYCNALLAFAAGDDATAKTQIDEAKRLYPDLCEPYDSLLKAVGYTQ